MLLTSRGCLGRLRGCKRLLEVSAEGVHRVVPGVTLIPDKALQDCEVNWLSIVRPVLKVSGQQRCIGKFRIAEELADFHIRICPWFYFAEQLQDETVSIDDGTVA